MASAAAQRIIEEMRAQAGAPLKSLEQERGDWEAFAKTEKLPQGTLVSGVSFNEVPCEWVERADSDMQVVMLIHGGGFNAGSPRTHRKFAANFAQLTGRRVLLPDYRLAPEHRYPAAIDDIIAVYAGLLAQGVERHEVVVCGDSAGGAVALATLLSLREVGAPLPAGLILFSPWLDLTLSGESHKLNAGHPNASEADFRRSAAWYAGDADPADPFVSPLFADLAGLPPMLIQAGGHETLLDDAVRLHERAQAAGVASVLSVAPEMWHVFQVADCPEARAAVEEAAAFVNNVLSGTNAQGDA